MIVKLLTEHHLRFLSQKEGCTGLSESTLVKMPNCWESHALAQIICWFFKAGIHGMLVQNRKQRRPISVQFSDKLTLGVTGVNPSLVCGQNLRARHVLSVEHLRIGSLQHALICRHLHHLSPTQHPFGREPARPRAIFVIHRLSKVHLGQNRIEYLPNTTLASSEAV